MDCKTSISCSCSSTPILRAVSSFFVLVLVSIIPPWAGGERGSNSAGVRLLLSE